MSSQLKKATFVAGSIALLVTIAGCSGSDFETVEAISQAALPPECEALGDTINEHTCEHGSLGPFGSLTASSNPNFTGSNPRFSGIHKYYTVTLPGSGSSYSGTVKFTPAANDDHAIYVHPSVDVTVRDKNGNSVSSGLTGTVSGCSYLAGYEVFDLKTSDAPYRITLAAQVSTIHVALEEVSPMGVTWFVDNDGDGYGPLWPFITTACVPWSPYVVTETGDCDDNDPNVYPGNGC